MHARLNFFSLKLKSYSDQKKKDYPNLFLTIIFSSCNFGLPLAICTEEHTLEI